MKLLSQITYRLSIVLLVVLSVWAALFFYAMVEEITDEVDDALEDYSEQLISRSLAGVEMPAEDDGTNNSYHITELDRATAIKQKGIEYKDVMMYIQTKNETEPARVMTTVFCDAAGKYYKLTVSTPTIEKDDLTKAILYWTIFLYIVLLLIIILVNVWVYYGSMKPLHNLLKWFDGYTIGSQNVPLCNDTKIIEFQKLNTAVIRSTERSEIMYEQQKQFISNASHEIQTPIAICQNRLEMLLDTELSEEQMGEILKTKQTLSYIGKLNKSLLFLSKIDNKQFSNNVQVDMNELCIKLLSDFSEAYQYKEITTEMVNDGHWIISINETLATTLLSNLLKNAYVHTSRNAKILIKLRKMSVEICNSGTEPLDAVHIFERFYQGTKKEGSTGLGLAIVEAICHTYSLTISYSFEEGMHCFCVTKK